MRDPIDPRADMMIASLYGELTPEEDAKFRQMLDEDSELRAEYIELQETRAVLAHWEVEETSPSFVLMGESSSSSASKSDDSAGIWQRLVGMVRGNSAATGWAFAAVAAVVAIIALVGARIEMVDGGGVIIAIGAPEAGGRSSAELVPETGQIDSALDPNGPITRRDFDNYQTFVAKVLAAMSETNESNNMESQQFVNMTRSLFEDLQSRQNQDYYELRGMIDQVRFENVPVDGEPGEGMEGSTRDPLDLLGGEGGESLTPDPNEQGEK